MIDVERAAAWLAAAAIVAAATLASSCRSRSKPGEHVAITVFAASSLTEAFSELAQGFEQAHPGIDVQLSFAGSQILRLQIEQGAAADLFASANAAHVQALADAGLTASRATFAANELVVIVPLDNPAGIERFADLAAAKRIVIGSEAVPVGAYTREVLERARAQIGEDFAASVRAHVVSEESNVRLVRAKVELGEADAAVVYRTDAVGSARVRVVEIPEALDVRARYPIAALARSDHGREAGAFIDYVLSPQGREILGRHGFVIEPEGARE